MTTILKVKKKPIKELLLKLHKQGPEIVVITDGKQGVYAYDGKDSYVIKPHNVKVLETTGAGDSFASGFLAGLLKRNDIEFALQLGLAEAESVITHYGAKNKLLTWNEALKIIKNKPGKISFF